jgi:hypothetical protein
LDSVLNASVSEDAASTVTVPEILGALDVAAPLDGAVSDEPPVVEEPHAAVTEAAATAMSAATVREGRGMEILLQGGTFSRRRQRVRAPRRRRSWP